MSLVACEESRPQLVAPLPAISTSFFSTASFTFVLDEEAGDADAELAPEPGAADLQADKTHTPNRVTKRVLCMMPSILCEILAGWCFKPQLEQGFETR
jgi:hypothetical protein